jgi:hypothetical protein
MTVDHLVLREEGLHLAQQLFGEQAEMVATFADRLMDTCVRAHGKDFLLIHNPGGWGNNTFERCLQWEKNIVMGISATVEKLGYERLLVQYFRTGSSWLERLRDVGQQFRFFATKAEIMAAELEFITHHIDNLRVILIGISQGAAFTNSVMQQLTECPQVYSIELGMFFPYLSRRVITGRTLSLDSNGLVPDAAVRRDLMAGARAYMASPFRWLGHLLVGRPVRFSQCVNVRGHDYDWGYAYVQRRVVDFLESNFGTTTNE